MKKIIKVLAVLIGLMMLTTMIGCRPDDDAKKTVVEDNKESNVSVLPNGSEDEDSSDEEGDAESDALDDQDEEDKTTGLGIKGASTDDENGSDGSSSQSDNGNRIDGWSMSYEDIIIDLPYESPSVNAVPEGMTLSEQYASMVNVEQVTGFTDNQLKMLEENGFVVMQPKDNWPALKMHVPYETAEYDNLPVIVTSDAVLNMYHIFYSESMKRLEIMNYSETMKSLSARLLIQVEEAYAEASIDVREEMKYVYAYIAVANELGKQSGTYPEEVGVIVDEELANIEGLALRKSVLYDKDVDYSQYTVRGHYTRHETLSDYFKMMMWYSQTGLQLTEGLESIENVNYDMVARSLMLTHMMFEDELNMMEWSTVYQLTSLYSGSSDDLNPFNLKTLIENVYGDERSYEAYMDASYHTDVLEALKVMPQPQINAKISASSPVDMTVGLQFRLMGQRYSLDAEILQELMEPIVRPYPTAFDVLAALEHPVAEEILYEYHKTNQDWPDYDSTLADMKVLTDSYDGWKDNLYSGWLWSIDAAAQSFEGYEDYPELVTSRAWSLKNLSSALGSYAELKHDNILYSKQAMAEMGGPELLHTPQYVEPNVELYSRLLWLSEYSLLTMNQSGVADELLISELTEMRDMLQVLLTVSQKQLSGETVTAVEFDEIKWIGGLIDYLQMSMYSTYYQMGIDMSPDDTTALIADVATVLNDGYLEEGTGLPREIYAVCYVNGESFLARGTVFSYYEFVSPKRLTDEDWHQMIGLEKTDDYGYTMLEYKPEMVEVNHLELMPWMSVYISNEPNNTEIQWDGVYWNDN